MHATEPSHRTKIIQDTLLDCLRSLVLLTATAAGIVVGTTLSAWWQVSNCFIVPWACGFMGLLIGTALTNRK